jgi:hypothetical protein
MKAAAGLVRYVFIANLATSTVWPTRYVVKGRRAVSPSFDLFHRGDVKRHRGGGSSLDQQTFDSPSLLSTIYHVEPQLITHCTFSMRYRYKRVRTSSGVISC